MKKINGKLLLLTSLITLFPMVVGLFLWKKLPDTLPSHFGFDGTADGFSSKSEAVFMIPVIMVLLQILVVFVTTKDPKAGNVATKVREMIYWMIPVLSNCTQLLIFASAVGLVGNSTKIGLVLIAVLFIILGNYLPKIKQNYTVGIKVPWTLHDEENWNKTHRMAGKLWVTCGLIIVINAFLHLAEPIVFTVVMFTMVLLPIIYSFLLAKRKSADDKES